MKRIPTLIFLITVFINVSMLEKPDEVTERIKKKYDEIYTSAPVITARGKVVAKRIRFIQREDKLVNEYSKLHQIALVRHGQPDMELQGKYTSEEANQYLKCYDSVCIIVPETPFFQIGEKEEVKVFSSPINRALTTARYIFGLDKEVITSPIFREFENKISNSNPGKKKSMKFWNITNRTKWILGGGKEKDIESFKQAKNRAKEAASILADASTNNSKVLLTAHGLLNHYIKKNLEKMGWKVVEETGNDYFGTTVLVKLEQ